MYLNGMAKISMAAMKAYWGMANLQGIYLKDSFGLKQN